MRQGIADVRGEMRSWRSSNFTVGSTNRLTMEGWQRIRRNSTAGQGFPVSPKASNVRGGSPSMEMNASSPIGANTTGNAQSAGLSKLKGKTPFVKNAESKDCPFAQCQKCQQGVNTHLMRTRCVRIKSVRDKIRGELFTMSPREGINLLCTNMGIISPLRVCVRVCVRAGGAA